MGKMLLYVTIFVVIIFCLEFFEIVDVPFFEIPDFFSGKATMTDTTNKALESTTQ